jgi:hypothetical protein
MLLYVVLMLTRKLKHYFLAHSVRVISDRPLARVLQIKEATGYIAQWVAKISHYDVEFIPQRVIKSQVLTDLIAEWTNSGLCAINELPDHWVMYFERSRGWCCAHPPPPPPPKVISLNIDKVWYHGYQVS